MKKYIYIPILSRICVTPSLAVKVSKATKKKKLLPSSALSLLGCESVKGNKNICCHLRPFPYKYCCFYSTQVLGENR